MASLLSKNYSQPRFIEMLPFSMLSGISDWLQFQLGLIFGRIEHQVPKAGK